MFLSKWVVLKVVSVEDMMIGVHVSNTIPGIKVRNSSAEVGRKTKSVNKTLRLITPLEG